MATINLSRTLVLIWVLSAAMSSHAASDQDTPDLSPAKLLTIFTNLGRRGNLYEKSVAWDVVGPDAGGQKQWVAMPFTPNFDAEVTQISVAVAHKNGSPNSFVLSLNLDEGGQIPGKSIRSWLVTNAPKFHTCCILDVVTDSRGINVSNGVQYWVVAKTNRMEKETHMEWDLSPRGIEGNFALNNGHGWYEDTAFTSAFAVYGRNR